MSRGLRALSSAYVERRGRLSEGGVLSGAGKRAAFALFYGPLHYLLVREILRALPAATTSLASIVDLGCGTGAAGAAWAADCERAPDIVGIDRHSWAVSEAGHTYRAFGLRARTQQGDVVLAPFPKPPCGLVAAFIVNELADASRDRVLHRLLVRAKAGDRVLVVEPIAGSVAPWWRRWRGAFVAAGARDDEWRIRVDLPPIVTKLDRAAGLHHRELTARSLWLPGV